MGKIPAAIGRFGLEKAHLEAS